ncbi:helix-turn-helix transcriptional regulator [Jannaschia sp. CCS1]|uniref:helix-turn-helix transcriptional regulator n=1 Tax=Jannaschia sp. (strain CCS1) TaxID=290400 RepID=UPI000053AC0E|nr:AlpA family phage regulatory protein [Jannaschia sp. CCS1]
MKYITLKELQTKLGNRSRNGIYGDIENGRIPKPKKLGNRLYWSEDEIDAVMSDREAA